jgi:radical SAM protein with 4Fe4S-binding SPASM domain
LPPALKRGQTKHAIIDLIGLFCLPGQIKLNDVMAIPYSKLRDQSRATLASQLPLAHPWSIYVELTNRCNFKCKFCPESFDNYSELVGGLSTLSFDQFRKICDDILEMGKLKVLRFYMMGEPFLHKELPNMIAYAKKLEVAERFELTSNGTALTEATGARMLDSGLDYLRISVYAIDAERHKEITKSNIHPDLIRNNVRNLFELRKREGKKKPFIYAKMINPFDDAEEKAFFENYSDISDEAVIEQPMSWDNPEGFDFIDSVYDKDKEIDRTKLFAHRKEVCSFPFYTLVVHSSGDVSVCCVDWEKKTVCGNVFKESLKDIWHGPKLRAFQQMQIERRRHENAACKNCTYLYTSPDNIDEITDIRTLYPDG